MSHFTVVVRISAALYSEMGGYLRVLDPSLVNTILREKLAPYNEQPEEGSEFLEFNDVSAEYRERYENEKQDYVRTPSGKLLFTWSEEVKKLQFPNRDIFGIDPTGQKEPLPLPDGWEQVTLPHSAKYPTFEIFMKEYAEIEANDDGRHGYMRNPNAKWDWYTIGGRWSGFFPVKDKKKIVLGEPGAFGNEAEPGKADMLFVRDLDRNAILNEWDEDFNKTYESYSKYVESKGTLKEDSPFSGPRSTALDLGLCEVFQSDGTTKPELKENQFAVAWKDSASHLDPSDGRYNWFDVVTVIDKSEFERRFKDTFYPIKSYAVLDDEWRDPGRMGWFGCSSATGGSRVEYSNWFIHTFMAGLSEDDILVAVDCHI